MASDSGSGKAAVNQRTAADIGFDVLQKESAAIAVMAETLPADFEAVVDRIIGCEGRVVISGVGKSGHIGHKIAATFASTGTPSYFVHATEASHGDLGMVTPYDVCIVISNSGETSELRDFTLYTRRFNIPLIAISSKPESTLMKAADYRLTLPQVPEVCAIGKAPTTSTTLTLALGDALAVAAMEKRGFNADQFQTFHPGGKLGSQMQQVHELMHGSASLPIVSADTPMSEALLTMSSKGFGIVLVVENGRLKGIVSDGDLRRNMDRLMERNAGEIASVDPVTVPPDMLAAQALAILNERKIGVLAVSDHENKPVGILHIHDLLRAGVA